MLKTMDKGPQIFRPNLSGQAQKFRVFKKQLSLGVHQKSGLKLNKCMISIDRGMQEAVGQQYNSESYALVGSSYILVHGLRTPNKAFKLGICGIFSQTISTYFGTVSPLSIFSINQSLFLQKTKPLYPHTKYFLGLGFEFGPQRIKDLTFLFPQSVPQYIWLTKLGGSSPQTMKLSCSRLPNKQKKCTY